MTLASAGQRLVAGLLDLVVVGLYIWLMNTLISSLFTFTFADLNILSILLIFLPITLYLPVSEYLWNGRTVGKYLMKMRVLNESGSAASLGDILLRWMLRTIDIKIGFILFFFAPENPTSVQQEQFMFFAYFFWIVPLPVVGQRL